MGIADLFCRYIPRTFFVAAFLLLGLAVAERVAFAFGYTILHGVFTGGRLLEFAVILLVVVISVLLREIREQLKTGGTK